MNVPQKKKYSVWLVLLLLALIGIYAADLIPAAAGRDQAPQAGAGGLLFTVLFCVLLWRRQGRNGWWGAAAGVAIFAVLTFAGGFMRGYVRGHSLDYQLKRGAEAANKDTPKMVGDGVRFDHAYAGPGALLTYELTFTNADARTARASFSDLSSSSHKSMCESNQLLPLLSRGVSLHAIYRGSDGGAVGTVSVDSASCSQRNVSAAQR